MLEGIELLKGLKKNYNSRIEELLAEKSWFEKDFKEDLIKVFENEKKVNLASLDFKNGFTFDYTISESGVLMSNRVYKGEDKSGFNKVNKVLLPVNRNKTNTLCYNLYPNETLKGGNTFVNLKVSDLIEFAFNNTNNLDYLEIKKKNTYKKEAK